MLEISEVGITSEWQAGDAKGRRSERSTVMIEIVLDSAAGGRTTRISDLSQGGCFVESINTYRTGELIAFDLKDSNGRSLKFSGIVVYVLEGFGFGLEFTELNDAHTEFLKRHTS